MKEKLLYVSPVLAAFSISVEGNLCVSGTDTDDVNLMFNGFNEEQDWNE